MNKQLFKKISGLLVAGAILAGCGAEETEEQAAEKETEQVAIEEVQDSSEAGKNNNEGQALNKEESKLKDSMVQDTVIDLTAFEFGYTPSNLTLEKGKEYELIMTNEGNVFHDLNIRDLKVEVTYMSEMPEHPDEMAFLDKIFGTKKAYAGGDNDHRHGSEEEMKASIHMNAKADQTVRIKFIPKETGTFELYCSLPGHEEAGMVGQIIVK